MSDFMQWTNGQWGIAIRFEQQDGGSDHPPLWADVAQQAAWRLPGLILWNTASQELAVLHTGEALHLLEHLWRNARWRYSGMTLPAAALVKRFRRPRRVLVVPTEVTRIVLAMLEMAEEALHHRVAATRAMQHNDLSLGWHFDEATQAWIFESPYGRITLTHIPQSSDWRGYFFRPQHSKQQSTRLASIAEARVWAKAVLSQAKQDSGVIIETCTAPLTLDALSDGQRAQLAPYWIAPRELDVAAPTYRVVLRLLQTSPGSSDGPPLTALIAAQLRSSDDDLVIETVDAWMLLRGQSAHVYTDRTVAMHMAQQLWERIAPTVKPMRATIEYLQLGIQEQESQFFDVMHTAGVREVQHASRAAYVAEHALRLSIAHALDVVLWPAVMGVRFRNEFYTRKHMHQFRLRVYGIPAAAQAESAVWLDRQETDA